MKMLLVFVNLIVILSCTFSGKLFAQSFVPSFRNYSTQDGLPSSEVYQIKQDKRGFIWIVSDNGISRFDGNEFINFNKSNGLCAKTIFGIYEDDCNRIWFYSLSGAIVYYDYANDRMNCIMNIVELFEKQFPNTILNGLLIHQDSIITFDYSGNTFKAPIQQNGPAVYIKNDYSAMISNYGSEKFVFGGYKINENSKLIYKDILNKKEKIVRNELEFNEGNYSITSGIYMGDSIFYMTLKDQILIIDLETDRVEQIGLDFSPTNSLYVSSDSTIWIGSFKKGVYSFNPSSRFTSFERYLETYSVTSVLEDNEGGYWFTTLENGVFYTPNLEVKSITLIDPLRNNKVTAFAKKDSLLFYSGKSDNINELNTKTMKILSKDLKGKIYNRKIKLHIEDQILSFIQEKAHFYDLKDSFKLIHQDNKIFDIKTIDNEIYTLVFDNSRHQVKKGLFHNSVVIKEYTVDFKRKIRHSTLTENLNYYYSTHQNLYYNDGLNPKKVVIQDSQNEDSILVNHFYSVSGDSVWVSTKNYGSLLIDDGVVIEKIDKNSGLIDNAVNHTFQDFPWVFISTYNGVYRKNLVQPDSPINNLNYFQGLPSNEINACIRIGNDIYLATGKGICIVDLSVFNQKPILPKCYIDTVKLKSKYQLETTESIMLNYYNNNLTIEYGALSFQNAFKVPFRYRLSPIGVWYKTYERKIQLAKLQPGKYKFEIQASGATGHWGESAFLSFTVLSPFWLKPWFIVFALLMLLSTFYIIYRLRLQNIRKLNDLNNSLLVYQNQAMSAQINPHFVFNSLNSILNLIIKKNVKESVTYVGVFGKLMRNIFENSQDTFISLRDEINAVQTYLEIEKIRLKSKLHFQIEIQGNLILDNIFLPALLIQPFVENAIWHGIAPKKEGGYIKISISEEESKLIIRILDNGAGIKVPIDENTKMGKTGLGLTIRRILLIEKLYKKKISISIKPYRNKNHESGTEVSVILPFITFKPLKK